jgi:predicted deacylase
VCANVLAHLGVLEATHPPSPPRTRFTRVAGSDGYVYAPRAGVFEPFHPLGAEVKAGEPAGAVHFLDDPGRAPERVRFTASGVLFARRAPGRVLRGSCVGVVGVDTDPYGV